MHFYKDAAPGGAGWLRSKSKTALDGKGTAKYSRRREAMNKRTLIKKIIARLTDELEVYFRAANASRAEATHEQNKAEDKYDTRGLEASYLARGQSRQAAEIESAIAEFEKLAAQKFNGDGIIDIGALVELEHGGENSFYFLGPRAGGTEVVHEKKEILVITPQSPLGEQLMGRKQGDQPQLTLGGVKQTARIVSVE
jgi:transcription elongation GreA/GreB family factor